MPEEIEPSGEESAGQKQRRKRPEIQIYRPGTELLKSDSGGFHPLSTWFLYSKSISHSRHLYSIPSFCTRYSIIVQKVDAGVKYWEWTTSLLKCCQIWWKSWFFQEWWNTVRPGRGGSTRTTPRMRVARVAGRTALTTPPNRSTPTGFLTATSTSVEMIVWEGPRAATDKSSTG